MKTPRLNDFDPNATLKSGLEHMPSIQPARKEGSVSRAENGGVATITREDASTPVRENARTGSSYKRHPFDFRKDQLADLKRLSLEEQFKGGEGSMSAMVREAVDEWLSKRKGGA